MRATPVTRRVSKGASRTRVGHARRVSKGASRTRLRHARRVSKGASATPVTRRVSKGAPCIELALGAGLPAAEPTEVSRARTETPACSSRR